MKTEEIKAIAQRIPAIPREQMSLFEQDRVDLLAYVGKLQGSLDTQRQELADQEEDKLELLGEVRKARQLLANAEYYLSTALRPLAAEVCDAAALITLTTEFLEETKAAYGPVSAAPSFYPTPTCPANCGDCGNSRSAAVLAGSLRLPINSESPEALGEQKGGVANG